MAQRTNKNTRKESKGKPQRSRSQKSTTITSKATSQRQDPDTELVSILQRNDLYDDLYKVLIANRIGLRDLRQMKQNEIDQYCREYNFNTHQTKQFKKLMRIIYGNDFDNGFQMQVIVIGDKSVGKTSLIQRYVL
eukprot:997454_1